MTNELDILSFKLLASAPCLVDVDEFVPLRFRSHREPIGAAYISLGNRKTTLLEFLVEPDRGLVRGVTITAYRYIEPWQPVSAVAAAEGLPVLSPLPERTTRLDLNLDFHVAVRNGEVAVSWGQLGECDVGSFSGRVHFLSRRSHLVGVWFTGLSDGEVKVFSSHATPQGG